VTQSGFTHSPATIRQETGHHSVTLLLIGLFKLVKATLLMVVGFGALRLIHQNIADMAKHLVEYLRIDPDKRYIHALLAKLLGVDAQKLRMLSVGAFIYGGVYLIEGVGLLRQKRWAEYMTILTTAGLIPLEVYEMDRRRTAIKILLLLVNVAIVVFLIVHRWRAAHPHRNDAGYVVGGRPTITR
jgi:uncharacterized membrane protein (DUF2068 family)